MTERNETILSKLCYIISESIHSKPTNIDIMLFLLGDRFTEDDDLSPNTLRKYRSHQTPTLSPKCYELIASSQDWSIERFSNITGFSINSSQKDCLTQNIYHLYREYFSDCLGNPNISDMLHALVHLHFFGCKNANSFFKMYVEKQCDNYIHREELEEKLSDLLKINNLLFITGGPATGKKELVKNYIEKKQNSYTDIGFSYSDYDYIRLEERVLDLPFVVDRTEQTIRSAQIFLREKSCSSLLIIDAPILTQEDFIFIDDFFNNLPLKIIFTTRTTSIPLKYASINVNAFPEENLFQLYNSWLTITKRQKTSIKQNQKNLIEAENVLLVDKRTLFSEEEFKQLCQIINYNPYIMTLLSRVISNSSNIKELKSYFLDSTIWVWKNALPPIHSSYKNKSIFYTSSSSTFNSLVFRILENYDSSYLSTTGIKLSVFAKEKIDRFTLSYFITDKDIQYAIDSGMLVYTDTDQMQLQMPNLIAHALWQCFPIPDDLINNYGNEIIKQLDIILKQPKISFDSLYTIVSSMVYRYHFNIFIVKTYKGYKHSYHIWNSFLLAITEYFNQLGNSNLSLAFRDLLFKCKNMRHPQEDYFKKHPTQYYIEKLIDLQNEALKNKNMIQAIKNIDSPDFFDIKQLSFKKEGRIYKNNLINSLHITISQVLNDLVQREHTILLLKIYSGNPPVMDESTIATLEALDTGNNIFAHKKTTPLSVYYLFIYNYLLFLYGNNTAFNCIQQNHKTFSDLMVISHEKPIELCFCFKLLDSYYSVLHKYILYIYTNTPYSHEFFQEYRNLCYEYYLIWSQNKFSLNATWLLYSFAIFLDALLPQELNNLCDILDNIQIALSRFLQKEAEPNYYQYYLQIVKDIKNQTRLKDI